ncbi:MAG TPA: M28 family peptidase, partial [Ignavibacteriales bacterium]|nr:M28 family peptidase [Ignavibacteriales bacterium]
MKSFFIIIIFIAGNLPAQKPTSDIFKYVSEDSYKETFSILSSDSLEGRGTGTAGGSKAAEFIAKNLAQLGLTPANGSGSFYQSIPMHSGRALPSSKFIIYANQLPVEMKLNKDYLLYKSGEQTFLPLKTPLVFAGYGITAPEFDYNDYQTIDVAGKIAVLLSGEPYSEDARYFNGGEPTIYSYPEVKQRVALSRGAAGTIIIPNPRDVSEKNWEYRLNQFSFEDVSLAYSPASNFSALINPNAADVLFAGSGYSLAEIFKADLNNSVTSFPLIAQASFKGDFIERDFMADNVAALLEGSDPELKDSYIIVSAHYDHLGIGPAVNGDSIYNGAFDNAAGAAAVLELAKAFSHLPVKPKRSILFLFLTGEEKGLLGSSYYVNNPLLPLYKTAANINIDGLSMFDEVNSFVGVGSEFSTLDAFLLRAAEKLGVKTGGIPPQFKQDESFSQSDQFAFAQAGIPSMLVLEEPDYKNLSKEEGLKKLIYWMENIYHTPFDDAEQDMDYKAVMQHVKLLAALIHEVADSDKTPEWKEGSPFLNARLQ